MKKKKAVIAPYKDGRTDNLNIRINPDKKALIQSEAKRLGLSQADYIISLVMKSIEKASHE